MVAFFVVMAVLGLIGLKKNQSQMFLENGARIPVTQIAVEANRVYQVRTADKDNYTAVQFGISTKKHANKAALGHAKKAASDAAPFYLTEIRKMDGEDLPSVGDLIKASDIFKEGDVVDVSGVSKGKGFAGVVKRHGFHGGPKTHGQSDRHRAPGAIGQGTTPGRVYKGKRMAGRMGQDKVTIRNLVVMGVTEDEILVKGLVPGIKNTLLVIHKVGEDKKFVPIYREVVEEENVEQPVEEVKAESSDQVQAEVVTEPAKEAAGADESVNEPNTEEKIEAQADQVDKAEEVSSENDQTKDEKVNKEVKEDANG